MTDKLDPNEIEQLIHDVLHGKASDEDRQRLSDWVTASEDNARHYLRVAMDERSIQKYLERDAARSLDALDASMDDSGAGMLLAELARAEAAVDAPVVELFDLRITWWRENAKPLMACAGMAVAAMIALAVALMVQPTEPINQAGRATQNDATDSTYPSKSPTPSLASVVATLTAEHDAQWAEGAFARGSALHAEQTLTLTQGFAEITTNHGAVAILEAPATVELLDNNNALRLHTGKLVGLCQTPASKGFTVYTPVAKVRDIGTRFSVQHLNEKTQISVLKGKVEAIATGQDEASWVYLTAGQHAEVTESLGEVVRIDQPSTGYVYDWLAVVNQPRLTGQAIYKATMPASLAPGDYEGDQPVVFAEHANIELPASFEVTFVSPGEYKHDKAFWPASLGEGTIVDCYFIQFDLPDRPNQIVTRTATLHFDRPIAGVITLPEHLLASGNVLDRPDVTYRQAVVPEGDPAIEGLDYTDTIRISEDGKTLAFELTSGPHIDQFRVLIHSHQEQPE
ncbi:MAG: FecR domain-containing protein [Phycisphaeraceae bacterium]